LCVDLGTGTPVFGLSSREENGDIDLVAPTDVGTEQFAWQGHREARLRGARAGSHTSAARSIVPDHKISILTDVQQKMCADPKRRGYDFCEKACARSGHYYDFCRQAPTTTPDLSDGTIASMNVVSELGMGSIVNSLMRALRITRGRPKQSRNNLQDQTPVQNSIMASELTMNSWGRAVETQNNLQTATSSLSQDRIASSIVVSELPMHSLGRVVETKNNLQTATSNLSQDGIASSIVVSELPMHSWGHPGETKNTLQEPELSQDSIASGIVVSEQPAHSWGRAVETKTSLPVEETPSPRLVFNAVLVPISFLFVLASLCLGSKQKKALQPAQPLLKC